MRSYWQYRVVLENSEYSIRSVYFNRKNGKNKYHSWSSEPSTIISDSIESLNADFEKIKLALSKPPLYVKKCKDGSEKLKKIIV